MEKRASKVHETPVNDKSFRSDKQMQYDKNIKSEKSFAHDKSVRSEKNNLVDKSIRSEKSFGNDKYQRTYRNEKSNFFEKSNKTDRNLLTKSAKNLQKIELDHINSMFEITSNLIFELYSASIKQVKIDNNVYYNVNAYLMVIQILDFDENLEDKLEKFLENSKEKYSEDCKKCFLKRIGYCEIGEKLTLIYEQSQTVSFNLEKISLTGLPQLCLLLSWFKSLIDSIDLCHENEMRIGLIHPDLLFIDRDSGLKMIDYIFVDLFKDYDFNSNLHIALYFGYFDIKKVNEIFSEVADPKISYKNEVILTCICMKYFFLTKNKISYLMLISMIEKDFLLKNTKFDNFISNDDTKEIRNLILDVININYFEIKPIKEIKCIFDQIVQSHIGLVKCEETECISCAKVFIYECEHYLCEKCSKTHKCEQGEEEIRVQKNYLFFKKKIDELRIKAKNISLPKQKYSNYFTKNIEPNFTKINDMHNNYEKFLNINEQKLNQFIEVVETTLLNKKRNDYERMVKFKNDLLNEIKDIVTVVRENQIKKNENFKKSIVKNQDLKNDFDKKKKHKNIYDGLLEHNLMKYKSYFERFDSLKQLITEYNDYLISERDLRMHLNYNLSITFLLSKIHEKSIKFLHNFKEDYYSKFLMESHQFTKKLIDNYEPFIEFEKLNILEEIKYEHSLYLGTVELKQNAVIFYNINAVNHDQQNKNEKKIKLNFSDDIVPKCIIPLCRWVNLKTKLIISGGVYKIRENNNKSQDKKIDKDIISKNIFYIDFKENDSYDGDQRTVIKLPDMLNERDQHCFLSISDFSLLSIGGSKTPTCEMFNFLTNQWTSLPSLDSPRYNCSAYIYNHLDIYLFFGLKAQNTKEMIYSDDILKLKLFSASNDESKWEKIDYKGQRINLCLNSLISLNKSAIILGGRISGENNYTNLNYTFDPETLILAPSKTMLTKKLCFLENNFMKIHHADFNFALFSSDFHLVKLKI